jgi:hypothetical protein
MKGRKSTFNWPIINCDNGFCLIDLGEPIIKSYSMIVFGPIFCVGFNSLLTMGGGGGPSRRLSNIEFFIIFGVP